MSKENKVGVEAIGVHWKEEELIPPKEEFIRQANMSDPKIYERFSEENYPECFKEYADMLRLGQILDTDARRQQPAVFQFVIARPLFVIASEAKQSMPLKTLKKEVTKSCIIWTGMLSSLAWFLKWINQDMLAQL